MKEIIFWESLIFFNLIPWFKLMEYFSMKYIYIPWNVWSLTGILWSIVFNLMDIQLIFHGLVTKKIYRKPSTFPLIWICPVIFPLNHSIDIWYIIYGCPKPMIPYFRGPWTSASYVDVHQGGFNSISICLASLHIYIYIHIIWNKVKQYLRYSQYIYNYIEQYIYSI